jgi:NADH:ubiquinone oxidoreductase subunit 3 (subunit A)
MNSLLMLFIFVPILVAILLALNFLFATHNPDSEKNQPYECGFSPDYSPTFFIFSIHHFNTALCFLVFDLEITLFFPISVTMSGVSLYGTSVHYYFLQY